MLILFSFIVYWTIEVLDGYICVARICSKVTSFNIVCINIYHGWPCKSYIPWYTWNRPSLCMVYFPLALQGSIHGLRVRRMSGTWKTWNYVCNGANVSHWNTFVSKCDIGFHNRDHCGKWVCNHETKCDKSGRPKNVRCITLSQLISSSKKKNMAIIPKIFWHLPHYLERFQVYQGYIYFITQWAHVSALV